MEFDWNAVSYIGETDFRQKFVPFGIRQADRLLHMYIIGQTGVGKSRLIERLAIQDLRAGRGFALIDPHGDLAERVWAHASERERDRLTYLNAPDPRQPYGYNPLRGVRDDRIPLAAAGLLETFRKQWPNAWGVRMEHVLRNSLFALLEREESDLTDILRLYNDKAFRKRVARDIRNDVVREFWRVEFENYPARLRAEAIAPIQNKLGALLSDPLLFRCFVRPTVDVRFRPLMDEGRGFLANLSRGELGEDAAQALGGMLIATIAMAAFTRADTPRSDRQPFFLYVDEFQSFTTLAFVNMVAELRKYGVGLTLAHQHLHQLEPDVRHAVLGNVGTLVSFRLGAEDASYISGQFQPAFTAFDLISLPNCRAYVRMMIDQAPGKPFSATMVDNSLPPVQGSSGPRSSASRALQLALNHGSARGLSALP